MKANVGVSIGLYPTTMTYCLTLLDSQFAFNNINAFLANNQSNELKSLGKVDSLVEHWIPKQIVLVRQTGGKWEV